MVAEMLRYLVVCACANEIKEIAHLDDDRQFGGPVLLRARKGQMMVIAPGTFQTEPGKLAPEPREDPDSWTARFTEHNVTETHWNRWGEPRITWSVRCMECGQHAQMSEATLESMADKLAMKRHEFGAVPVSSTVESLSISEDRHVVPLGVLCLMVTQLNG